VKLPVTGIPVPADARLVTSAASSAGELLTRRGPKAAFTTKFLRFRFAPTLGERWFRYPQFRVYVVRLMPSVRSRSWMPNSRA
jgi:hypothetical protein